MSDYPLLGDVLKEEGLAQIERSNREFAEEMRQYAAWMARVKGEVTIDDLREHAARNNLAPSHPNAWGAVFRGAQWKVIGRRKSRIPSNHAREIKVWALKGEDE